MKHIFRTTIAKSLFGSFLIVIVPIIILSFSINYLSMDIVKNEISESYLSSVTLLSNQVGDRLQEIESLAGRFALDHDMLTLYNSSENPDVLYGYAEFAKKMNLYSSSNFLEADITILFMQKGRIISSQYGVDRLSNVSLENLQKNASQSVIWAFRDSIKNDNRRCLSILKGYYNMNIRVPMVYIEINHDQVKKLLDSLNGKGQITTFILDSRGNLFTNRDIDINSKDIIINNIFKPDRFDNTGEFTYTNENKRYRIIHSNLSHYNITMGMIFDEGQIVKPIDKIRHWLLVCLLSSILLSGIFIVMAHKSILTPVNTLIAAMKKIKTGDLNVRVPVDKKYDLGFMFEQFNSMVAKLHKLVNDVYVARLKLKQSQIKFLQSQINPHFLYNSLFSVYNMIKNEDLDNAADMTLYLGKYYQFSAHSDRNSSALREEIDNITVYVNIYTMCSSGKISFMKEVEKGLEDFTVPRLAVQTIVENAVIHGIKKINIENPGIWLKVSKEDNFVVIAVEDNGIGIPREKIEELEKKSLHINYEDDHHGIINSYCRFKLMYGEEVKMQVTAREPSGTRVVIKIPYYGKGAEEDV